MTPEEHEQLKGRLEAYSRCQQRSQALAAAMASIQSGKFSRLSISLQEQAGTQSPLMVIQETGHKTECTPLVFSRGEQGLADEMRSAILTILDRRMNEASQEMEAL